MSFYDKFYHNKIDNYDEFLILISSFTAKFCEIDEENENII